MIELNIFEMYKRFYFGEKSGGQIDFEFDSSFQHQGKSFYFQGNVSTFGSIKIWTNGWFVPRIKYYDEFSSFNSDELIVELIKKGIRDWNLYIKGNYTLVVVEDHLVTIMTDPHGLSKVYYRSQANVMEYSNHYSSLLSDHDDVSELYPALIALFQHPVGGFLPHKHLRFVENPSFIFFRDNTIQTEEYLSFCEDRTCQQSKVEINDLISVFDNCISQTKEYLEIDECLITLTGGRDTRSVLASLLKNKVTTSAFTFGFSEGKDVIISKQICKILKIDFFNPVIEPLTAESYENWVHRLINIGDPFIHLHRAHRLHAFMTMKEKKASSRFLWLGCMGGDYSKGVAFNDYIVTKFIRLYYSDPTNLRVWVTQILEENHLKLDVSQLDELIQLIEGLNFLEKNWTKNAELKLAYHFVGTLHDVQDMLLARYSGLEAFSPFMDIDFMEAQFVSKYNLYSAHRNSSNPLKKISGGELQANIICTLFPKLGEIPMANLYKPKDILGNKFLYLLKRIYLQILKVKDIPTFAYRDWFLEFVNRYLLLSENQHLLISSVNQPKEQEGAWHVYTNKIWIYLLKKQYDVRNIKK